MAIDDPTPLKDLEQEHPVPARWRRTIEGIVAAISKGDLASAKATSEVEEVAELTWQRVLRTISRSEVTVVAMSQEAWASAVTQWMGGYWDVMVDLPVEGPAPTDLVLSIRVSEVSGGYRFKVLGVYVP